MEAVWLLGTLVSGSMTPPQLCRLASAHPLASLALNSLAPVPDPAFRWVATAQFTAAQLDEQSRRMREEGDDGFRLPSFSVVDPRCAPASIESDDDVDGMHLLLPDSSRFNPATDSASYYIGMASSRWSRRCRILEDGYDFERDSRAFHVVGRCCGGSLRDGKVVVFSDWHSARKFLVEEASRFLINP
jgi:hypothetical protein